MGGGRLKLLGEGVGEEGLEGRDWGRDLGKGKEIYYCFKKRIRGKNRKHFTC